MLMKKIISTLLTLLHVVLVVLMVGIGLMSLFRPELIRMGIDWMGSQIKSW